jgi:predicted enzyme involved in methoxymalonyl-ACP biosynthesis
MLELLACRLIRSDESPNIELAQKLCESMDKKGIQEIMDGLKSEEQAVANDCIKVLYEIGQRKPELVTDFVDNFITALSDKNNRIVWGSMTALAYIAPIRPEAIFNRLPEIVVAYKNGRVITVDNSISVFAQLCKTNGDYQTRVFPILLEHLRNCRAKEIPQHAERMAVCINSDNKEAFLKALEARINELSEPQTIRILKLKKRLT